jgi:CRP-like cAMP-binding protein
MYVSDRTDSAKILRYFHTYRIVTVACFSAPAPDARQGAAAVSTPNRQKNRLLDALPKAECARLSPYLERVSLKLGDVLYESGIGLKYGYFPIDAIISLLYVMENGASGEIAVVGNEGMVGISLFMGGETTPSRAVVQSAGHAFRLKSELLKKEFALSGATQHLLLRYTQALITQMSQTAVCNRHHTVEQQLCRWLLLSIDRLPENQLTMTQQLIANMLGVRREGVTEAAGKLQATRLIDYRRGKITVLDRSGLEKRVCECYAVVKAETDRLLPSSTAG